MMWFLAVVFMSQLHIAEAQTVQVTMEYCAGEGAEQF